MTVDAKILSALRAAPWGVSGAELARNLRMTRAGVWGHIEQLRGLVIQHFAQKSIADQLHVIADRSQRFLQIVRRGIGELLQVIVRSSQVAIQFPQLRFGQITGAWDFTFDHEFWHARPAAVDIS